MSELKEPEGFKLPTGPIKATRIDPRTMVIFSQKKTGKTSSLAALPDNLILDFEGGTDFIDAMKVSINNLEELDNVLRALNNSKKIYNYITLDTVTSLNEKVLSQMAVRSYNKAEGKSEPLDFDVDTLSFGRGTVFKREALFKLLQFLEKFAKTVIITGHVADKSVTATGQTIKELNLPGKLKDLLALRVDAIGYMYRSPDEEHANKLSFIHSEEVIGGSRSKHLRNKEFTISKLVEDELETYWDQVFIDNK